ncbi:MAG: hypothetical protein C4331_02460 [Meiothermus sp.]
MRRGFGVIMLLLWVGWVLSQSPEVEKRTAQAVFGGLGAEATVCADYSQNYRAQQINADPLWSCGFLPKAPQSPQAFAEAFWQALGQSDAGRLIQIFSPLALNPACECWRTGAYYRRGGKLVAWSLSFADTRPYGKGTLIWVKHQVLR